MIETPLRFFEMNEEFFLPDSAKVHPTQVTEWKKMLVENIAGVFEGGKRTGKEDFEKERERDSIPRLVN